MVSQASCLFLSPNQGWLSYFIRNDKLFMQKALNYYEKAGPLRVCFFVLKEVRSYRESIHLKNGDFKFQEKGEFCYEGS